MNSLQGKTLLHQEFLTIDRNLQ